MKADARSSQAGSQPAFVRLELRTRDRRSAERAAAEAFEAGACGLEEREERGFIRVILYAPAARAQELWRALRERGGGAVALGEIEPVEATDWSQAWKAGLRAVEISPRLVVRPSFVAPAARPGQAELVVDPGQAFGTGGHASTRLALEWIEALSGGLDARSRVLDVGCGTGVLALAALRLGAGRAVAFDLDPLAAEATRANARANGLAERLAVFVGGLEALGAGGFALVVANLIRSELLPLLPELAARTARGGRVVLSGLLASEADALGGPLEAAGLRREGTREAADASGERWAALLTTR